MNVSFLIVTVDLRKIIDTMQEVWFSGKFCQFFFVKSNHAFLIYYVSCSYAGALFADACLKGLNGVPDVVECSFVQSTVTELPYFASKVIELQHCIFF